MSSRKLFITLLAMLLVLAGGLISIKCPIFAGLYATYIGGILSAAGLYHVGNVASTHFTGIAEAKKLAITNKTTISTEDDEAITPDKILNRD